jgi:hypothetical protein
MVYNWDYVLQTHSGEYGLGGQMHATVILIPVVQKHAMGDVSVV